MRCDEADALIDAFAEDALDAEPRRALAAHVAACARCLRAVEASRRLSASLASLPASAPSYVADERAWAAVEEEIAWARWRARVRRAVAGLAAAAAVAAVAFGVFVAAPAAATVDAKATEVLHACVSWLRLRAIPTVYESSGTIAATVALFVVVAAIERMSARRESTPRLAR